MEDNYFFLIWFSGMFIFVFGYGLIVHIQNVKILKDMYGDRFIYSCMVLQQHSKLVDSYTVNNIERGQCSKCGEYVKYYKLKGDYSYINWYKKR